jgi:hypothetical protein
MVAAFWGSQSGLRSTPISLGQPPYSRERSRNRANTRMRIRPAKSFLVRGGRRLKKGGGCGTGMGHLEIRCWIFSSKFRFAGNGLY